MGIAPAGMVTFAVVVLNETADPPPGTHPVTSGPASRGGAPASDASTTGVELSRTSGFDASTIAGIHRGSTRTGCPAGPGHPAGPRHPASSTSRIGDHGSIVGTATRSPSSRRGVLASGPASAPYRVASATGSARARPSALPTCRCSVGVGRIVLVLGRIVDAVGTGRKHRAESAQEDDGREGEGTELERSAWALFWGGFMLVRLGSREGARRREGLDVCARSSARSYPK